MRHLLVKIFTIVFSLSLNSQIVSSFEHYSIIDGLSQNTITCIYQSSNGLLWFGTQDGLNIYNGYEFEVIKNDPSNTNSLSNSHINDIAEDEQGNMYFATQNGLTIWDIKKNKFTRLFYDINDTLHSNNILKIIYQAPNLWILTSNAIIKLDNKLNTKIYPSQIIKNPFFYSFSTPEMTLYNNKLWISSEDGIIIFDLKTETFYRILGSYEKITNPNARSIFIDNNNIWIGTINGLNQLLPTNHFRHYFYLNNPNYKKENFITSIFIDTNNTFWLGTQYGIKTFDGNKIIDFENPQINSITSTITKIYKDNSNNIWIATVGDGLFKINTNKPRFNSLTDFNPQVRKIFFSIFVDNQYIYAGSNFLLIIDKNTKKIIKTIPIGENPDNNVVLNIIPIDNKLWICTNFFIYIFDPFTHKIISFFEYFDIPTNPKIQKTRVYKVLKINNQLWIATYNGLLKFDENRQFTIYNTSNILSGNIVLNIYYQQPFLWIATLSGLNILNIFTNQNTKLSVNDNLPNNYISFVGPFNDSLNIISSPTGFALINNSNFKVKKIFDQKKYNFKNDFFYCALVDKNYNIWLSSNYGVVSFDYKNNSFQTFSTIDGLPALEFNTNAYFLYNDTIYFGTTNGITWTNINPQTDSIKKSQVYFNKILYTDSKNYNEKNLTIDTNIVYKFNYKSYIKIFFYLSPSPNPKLNKYRYQIVGYTHQWSNIQTENFVNIIGLEPGQYTLMVVGQNPDGSWTQTPAKLKFIIVPPFIKSSIAKILLASFIILILSIVFYFYYRKIRLENQILTEKNIAFQQIEKQKQLLEEQAKNINDSLNYAQHIIAAMLSPIEQLNSIIPENFIYLRPKEIVSGDFYWFTEKNNRIYIAAVDCTGHGIPGAFMSIIGMNLLNRLVNNGHTDPGIILNLMNREIIEIFKKNITQEYIKDGMDIALCIIDINAKNMLFAGAYNPAYIIREDNLIQLKADRKSIGNVFDIDSFTTLSFKLYNDDVIYIFSDGYTDQFGGNERKKFKHTRFRYLLLTIHKLPFDQQREILHNTLVEWKGNHEQVDDILVIGFKPLSKQNLL